MFMSSPVMVLGWVLRGRTTVEWEEVVRCIRVPDLLFGAYTYSSVDAV